MSVGGAQVKSSGRPRISIVIPARDAATTLETPLRSVLAQTFGGWETIVVDNASADSTAQVAAEFAASDGRISVVTESTPGVSAARNLGLDVARGDFILFLDADDHLERDALAKVNSMLDADPGLDGVRYDWALESKLGGLSRVSAWGLDADATNLFDIATQHCPLAIHSCVIRREIVAEVGGFDESLAAGEDWDLWQRVARVGPRIGYVPEVLAYYVLRAGSATNHRFRRIYRDCSRVIDRLQAPDSRVAHPRPDLAGGAPAGSDHRARQKSLLWAVALATGAGEPAMSILGDVKSPGRGGLDVGLVVSVFYYSVPTGAGFIVDEWGVAWPELSSHVARSLKELAQWNGDPSLSERVLRRLESKVLVAANGDLDRCGETACQVVDVARPISSVATEAQRLVVLVRVGDHQVGWAAMPVFDGVVGASAMWDAIVEQVGPAVVRELVRLPSSLPRLMRGGFDVASRPPTWRRLGSVRPNSLRAARRDAVGLARIASRESLRASMFGPQPHDRAEHDSPAVLATRGASEPSRWLRAARSLRTVQSLPILMYHRIADDGPEALAPFRVSPDEFAEQLGLLRQSGFTSIDLEEWAASLRTGRSIAGRRVAITFDDGYRDLLSDGVPLLEEYGFTATVFVVADRVGTTADWDADFGAPAPLMTWDELRCVRSRGITIGSHTKSHDYLTAKSPAAVLVEERLALETLRDELDGGDVDLIAYPYGDIDSVQRQTVLRAGYRVGVTTECRWSTRYDDPLLLPRLDVPRGLPIDRFARMVGVDAA